MIPIVRPKWKRSQLVESRERTLWILLKFSSWLMARRSANTKLVVLMVLLQEQEILTLAKSTYWAID